MRKMLTTPTRGALKEGVSFGYVDVPKHLTPDTRPFLNTLTKASLETQQKIRKDREIDLRTEDITITAGGLPTRVRVFLPEGQGPFPMIVYSHGGGFAIRDVDCFDYIGRYLAKNTPAIVIMPDYALAPEYPFPTQVNQCYDTLLWAREHAAQYHADPKRDVVAGDSAGGNLSTVLCLKCRDEGKPQPALQVLAYPVVDATEGSDMRESEKLYSTGYNLDLKHLASYTEAYAPVTIRSNPYISPLFAKDLCGLADCLMLSAECDVLIDQGMEYLQRLKDDGVRFDYHIFKGMPHDFLFFSFEESYQAYDLICKRVRELK